MFKLFLFLMFWGDYDSTIASLFRTNKMDKCREYAEAKLVVDSCNAEYHYTLGLICYFNRNWDMALQYFNRTAYLDAENTEFTALSHNKMGHIYYKKNELEKSVYHLRKAISLCNGRSCDEAYNVLYEIDSTVNRPAGTSFDRIAARWYTVETEHIIFYFQDTAAFYNLMINNQKGTPREYITEHERAYTWIDRRNFNAQLPEKLKLYVWSSFTDAERLLGRPLGFALINTMECHLHITQTIGHEMTHVLSAWGLKIKNYCRLINEGLATALDLSKANYCHIAKTSMKGKNFNSILEVWKDADTAKTTYFYAAGACFINYLGRQCSRDEVKSILQDQTIDHARSVLGEERFNATIKGFDDKFNWENK